MLPIENLLLPFDLVSQLFLGGQIGQILGHEQMVIVMQHRVPRDILAGFTAQQDANGGIIAFFALQIIVHPHIHIDLPHVLMGDGPHFQVDEDICCRTPGRYNNPQYP